MFKQAICLLALSFSLTAFGSEVNDVGNALGRLFFGSQFKDGTGGEWLMNGESCTIELKLDAAEIDGQRQIHNFHLRGRKGSEVVIINAFRPLPGTLKVEQQAASDQILSFKSVGPCLGGFMPGSANCDENVDFVVVRKDPQGRLQKVKLKHRLDSMFSLGDSISCDF